MSSKKENDTGGYPGHRLQSKYRDSRHDDVACCIYCGGEPETKDHVPPKIFLDEPYPPDLPVVPACRDCNKSFSKNDLYVACLIECVKHGSLNPCDLKREKIKKAMRGKRCMEQLHNANTETLFGTEFRFDEKIMRTFFIRLARGHAAFECDHVELNEDLITVWFSPLEIMGIDKEIIFCASPIVGLITEIGSRASQRTMISSGNKGNSKYVTPWVQVEEENYEYLATAVEQGVLVRIIIGDFLAGECLFRNFLSTVQQ